MFITPGTFSAESKEYVVHIDPRVVLIDGRQLAEYMIDFNIGVTSKAAYEVKRVDSDYFSEEERLTDASSNSPAGALRLLAGSLAATPLQPRLKRSVVKLGFLRRRPTLAH